MDTESCDFLFYLDKLLIESWSFWIFATIRFCSFNGGKGTGVALSFLESIVGRACTFDVISYV